MALRNFVGNEHAVRFLRRMTEKGTLPHAWLFYGPPQVGKRTLAIEWAKLLNCQSPSQTSDGLDSCDQCPSCRHLSPDRPSYAQTHPAVQVVDTVMAAYWEAVEKAKETEEVDPTKLKPKLSLGINAIRTLRETLSHQTLWRYRVIIVDEAERLTEEASAALLKTLEEPPDRTLFILVSANPWAIHPTIRSRCQPLSFRLVPSHAIFSVLKAKGVTDDEASLVVRLARGRVGWAINAVREPSWQQVRERLFNLLNMMVAMSWWDVSRFAEIATRGLEEIESESETSMASQRRQLEELIEGLMLGWRDILATALGLDDLVVNTDWLPILKRAAKSPGWAIKVLQELRQTYRRIRPPLNANPQLALELLAIQVMQGALQ
ncbi:DNA polymerase-3 subunit delta' [Candidatus Fervidibacteria bacterium JGI MDM2 JNZ-1-D12]